MAPRIPRGSPLALACEVAPAPGGGTVVVAHGELDFASAHVLARSLGLACAASREVVLDLTDVAFMDGATLRAVVAADERHRQDGGRVVVVCGPFARWLLDVAADAGLPVPCEVREPGARAASG